MAIFQYRLMIFQGRFQILSAFSIESLQLVPFGLLFAHDVIDYHKEIRVLLIGNQESRIENDGFGITNGESCIENGEFCKQTDLLVHHVHLNAELILFLNGK